MQYKKQVYDLLFRLPVVNIWIQTQGGKFSWASYSATRFNPHIRHLGKVPG